MGDFSARLAQARERLKKNEEKKNTSPLEDRIAQARERLKPVREETIAPQRKTALRGSPAPVSSVGKDRMVNLDDGEYGTAKGGKFYSRPALYQDAEWMRADIMDTEGALLDAERRTGDAYAALKKAAAEMQMEPGNRLIANAYNDLLDEYKTVYGQYRTVADKYGTQAKDFNSYLEDQGDRYDAWRSTVRGKDYVQQDIDGLNDRIKELRDIEGDIKEFEISTEYVPADQRPSRDFGGFSSIEEVRAEIARLESQLRALRDELSWAKSFDYETVPQNEDFGSVVDGMRNQTIGWNDLIPDVFKGNVGARSVVGAIQNGTLDRLQEQYGFLTEEQQDILLYYAGRGEWDKATEYLEWAEKGLNQQAAMAQQERVEAFSRENPFWASVLSPAASVLGGVAGFADLLAQTVERGITGKPVDYNTEGFRLGSVADQVRGTVGGMIEDSTDFEIGGRNVAGFLYNTAMSGADSILSGVIPFGAVALGANAAQTRAKELAARGASDNQALAGGIAAGLFEGLFESVTIGNLNALKEIPVDGLKTFVLNIAKSAGVNASEEALTEIANIAFDALALGDVSDWQAAIDSYIADGEDPATAKRKAAQDLFGQVIEAAASGALMGVGFGTVGSAQSAAYSALERAAQEMAQNGSISNNTAERIMADTTAMEQLGVDTNGMTKSQTRNAVKDAVAAQNPVQDTASAVESTTAPVQQVAPQKASESETAHRIQQGARASAALGENGARAFKAAYDETTAATLSAEDAYSGFARVYNAALKGETVESDLPAHMKLAAEASAKRDAALANQQNVDYTETTNGVDANGEEVYLRNGSQRDGSAYSGGQVSAVEEGAGRNQGWHPAGQFADRGASALSYGERVSTSSLGIGGGSQQNDIRLLTGGDTEHTKEARRIAKERGLRVVFFAGNNLSIREGKDYASARGYISGDRVFIRVDHPLYTADQIMRHEAGHDMIAKGEVNVNKVRRRIKHELGRKTVKQAAKDYADAYEGSGLTADEIWEEIICDSLGDMNIFSGRQNAEAVAGAVLSESKKAVEATKKAPARAPPADGKMSRDGYSGDQVAWAVNNGVITESERAAFFQMIANIKKLGHKVRRTSHGGYIVDLGNKLLLTDGNWKNPSLSSVIIFNDTSETSMAVAKDVIFNGSHNKAGYDQSRQIIENAYWPGYVERYTEQNSASYAREVAGREGEDGGADYEGYGDRVNTYSPDYAHWRNAMKDGKASRDLEHGGVSVDPATESAFPAKFSRDIDQAKIDAAAAKNAERNAKIAGMIKQYGTIPAGENPAREVSVPRRTSDDKKVSQTVRTIMEAGATPDEALPNIEQMIADEEFSYEVYGDDKAVSEADGFVRNLGWDAAQREWFSEMGKGVVSKRNTTLGWMLYNNAVNSGKTTLAMDILNEMVKSQRNAAQALQATRILKKLSPETQLFGAQRSVANLIEDLKKRYGDKAPNLTIDQDMAERFLRAKTDKERAEAMQEIYRDIGRQMPSTFMDKFNAWRYLAMLGNTRTHVRNIMGNLGFAPVVAFKNLTAAGIERLVLRQGRTKSVAFATKEGRALLKAAWDDYTAVADSMPEGKYSDLKNANKYIEEGRVIFTSKLGRATVERARRFNSKALSAEDAWFSRPHYASALAQYCKTNGISVEAVQKGKGVRLEAARRYAMKEAQKATYQDANAFSEFFSRLGRSRSSNKWLRRGSMLVEGVLPFRKTPADILVRSVEYSPLGLAHGIKLALWDVQRGNATAAEAIDRISAGVTGSILLCLGLWMAAAGLVRGHGDDEKEKEKNFSELQGHQAYALELPNGTSVTLDWLAPEALPFFIGVNFWEMTSGMKDAPKMEDWLRAVGNVSEPLLEMSCLQGLNSMLDSVGYASSEGLAALPTIAVSAATSLMTQVIPTLFGQIERTGEDVRMTTYTDKNKWLDSDTQYFLGKVTSKIPGIDYGQIPYIDAWGRTEVSGGPFERAFNNFLNPAYMSEVNVIEMEKELERLYKATGEPGVLPSRAAKSFTVNGEEINLTGEQYVEYATYRGQRAYQLITELTECRFYSALSDAEKQKAVEKCYEVANEEAKSMISEFELGIFHKHLADAEAVGISNAEYIVFYKTVNSIKGEDRAQKIRNWLKNSWFTRQQKEFLWSTEYKGAY